MHHTNIADYRLEDVIARHAEFDFPEFLNTLRRSLGIQRRYLCQNTSLLESRMFYLEKGRFKRMPDDYELVTLAEYYGVDPKIMKRKCEVFLASGKAKPQYTPPNKK